VVLLRHRLYTDGVDPAIVEIEQAADHDRVVDRFVGPANVMKAVYVGLLDSRTVTIHLLDIGEQRFFGIGDRRRPVIFEHGVDPGSIFQQLRRDRGVTFDSKRTVV
jgi:hypothetical protein